eukprot:2997275-Amphidinium_carterae.1
MTYEADTFGDKAALSLFDCTLDVGPIPVTCADGSLKHAERLRENGTAIGGLGDAASAVDRHTGEHWK